MAHLFSSLRAGALELSSRVVMAPMTRSRADDEGRISELTARYYAQRASAGLIISEGIYPSFLGKGYIRTPGLANDAQIAGWRLVTERVHARGGKIVAQLMHAGRISDSSFLPNGALPVAPSAVRANGASYTASGVSPHPTPRALDLHEISGVIEEYRLAAERAFAAGFDGVELHGASGYLPEQFLSSSTNLRSDAYGGSVENRARFMLEALRALTSVRGGAYVGLKLSPEMGFNDLSDATPRETFSYLVESLAPFELAYLHVAPGASASVDYHKLLRPLFSGAYLAGAGFTQQTASAMIESGAADAIVFGAAYIANPDLTERFQRGLALSTPDRDTFYSPGAAGYTDYPAATGATSDVQAV